MDEANPQLYVEPAMSTEQRQDVQQQIVLGRAQVERFYGSITTTPYFVACMTEECDKRFGSYGTRAAAFGDVAIRLSANGLSAPLVAHEWSHRPAAECRFFPAVGIAVNRYGETAGDVPSNLHVVYTAAGHEVRGLLAGSGSTAVATVLESVSGGSTFDTAYVKAGRGIAGGARR